jgi:hypothetical protein
MAQRAAEEEWLEGIRGGRRKTLGTLTRNPCVAAGEDVSGMEPRAQGWACTSCIEASR